MKIFLAGTEILHQFQMAKHAGIKNILFSYYHLQRHPEIKQTEFFKEINKNKMESICDSGLFTMMFGAGKGKTYDLPFMLKYTDDYIAQAKRFNLQNNTIVECDVHKLLGMDAVFKLRKKFEKCGLNVMYVWHREESIDGLLRMADRYEYIAISVPELRLLFKGHESRYQDAVKDLLIRIRRHCRKMPKIHLLGNTVPETMNTNLAYSCDSTSWTSSVRFGRAFIFHGEQLVNVSIRNSNFAKYKAMIESSVAQSTLDIFNKQKSKMRDVYFNLFVSAHAYNRYQHFLDQRYQWIGLTEGSTNGKVKNKHCVGRNKPAGSKQMEPQQTK